MKRLALAGVLAGVLLGPAGGLAYDDGDTVLWLDLGANVTVADRTTVKVQAESWFSDDVQDYTEQEVTVLLARSLTGWLQVGLGMKEVLCKTDRAIYAGPAEGGGPIDDHYWTREDRPLAEATLRGALAGWKVENRLRAEYRAREGQDEFFRYRNRLKAKSPWQWTACALNPFAAWEVFYSDKDEDPGWDRYRYYGGLGARLGEQTRAELFYCLQVEEQSDGWRNQNLLGLAVVLGR